jgi:DNA modification methylase
LRSVEEFGYVEPIIWNERTGSIVGGHQRFKILAQLGYTEIECVVVNLDEQREKALNVALNKIGGEFDTPKLAELLQDLERSGFAVDITGFEQPEIDKLYQSLSREKGNIEEDGFDAEKAAAEIVTPVSQPGDIWLAGRHRLMCGDSTDGGAVTALMDGARARMMFTDPPWNVNYGGERHHPKFKPRQILNDSMTQESFGDFLKKAFRAAALVCDKGAMVYVVMSAQEWGTVMAALADCGYHWSSTIIWAKDSAVISRKDYYTQYEPIWYGWIEGEKRLCPIQDRGQSDLWQFDRSYNSKEHPTMKPIALVGKAVSNSSHNGDIVLDLFGGSGSTLMACEQSNRTCHTMELDPKYCDVIVRRFIEYQKNDSGVFLLREGEKLAYNEVPE